MLGPCFCYAVHCSPSTFAIISLEKRELIALLCCILDGMWLLLPFPHGAVGWSVVCDCGISRSYSLTLSRRTCSFRCP